MSVHDEHGRQKVARAGAAMFALGLMIAGPHAAGVAAADTGEDASPVSASTADSNPATQAGPAGRGVARSTTAAERSTRSARSERAGAANAPRAAAAGSAPARRGSSKGVGRVAAAPSAASDSPAAETAASAPAPEPVVGGGSMTLPSTDTVPTVSTASTLPDWAAEAAILNPQRPIAPSAKTVGVNTPVLTALANGINGALDGLANLLSNFPAGPVNDLLAGALLLTRRALSLIEPVPAGAPVATSVWLPNVGTYGTDGEMNFVVNFDQPVVVNNANVAVPVEINYMLFNAKYVSGSGTGSLLFSLKTPAEELDPSGIDLGTVSTVTATRVFDFGTRIVAKADPTVVASSAIPTVNTSRIAVDSMGPQITGRSDLQVSGSSVSLTVTFDRPVIVTGTPTVPVVLDGGLSTERNVGLEYVRGNQTNTLTFRLNNPAGLTISSAEFGKFVGDVIYLSPTAGISDRTGSQIYTLEGDIDTPLIENGNHVVVIGQHFEKLQTQTAADLNAILNGVSWPDNKVPVKNGERVFWVESTFGPPFYPTPDTPSESIEQWPFNTPYQFPAPVQAVTDVDLYRVAFRTSVPEEGNRYTTAYGIAALPINPFDAGEVRGVVQWQQPTVFNVKYSAPSQAFACGAVPTCASNSSENANPRLEIAQFGGQGYAVFIPDVFGMGNSPNRYAYQTVASAAQYSTDMLKAGEALLAARNLTASKLFIAGWSAGGNQNAAFLQSLEEQGRTVDGAVIASSPLNVGQTVENGIFNPRLWLYTDPTHTGDAIWLNIALGYTAFAKGGYEGKPSVPLELLGNYYDVARRIYTQQYTAIELGDVSGSPESFGVTVYFTDVDGNTQTEFFPYRLRSTPVEGEPELQNGAVVLKYSTSRDAFNTSEYAKLMNNDDSVTGQELWTSPVMLNYGYEDEVLPVSDGQKIYDDQLSYGNQNIQLNKIVAANHRGTYLQAMANALEWFNSIAPGFIITGDGVE